MAYEDSSYSAGDWEKMAVEEFNSGGNKNSNHTCWPKTCHKGRWKKIGFCRMHYWHWRKVKNTKGKPVIKRVHGHALQRRWCDDKDLPPVVDVPPQAGMPALERNHCYHGKMTPGVMLAARCNHDLGILLRLPVLSVRLRAALLKAHEECLAGVSSTKRSDTGPGSVAEPTAVDAGSSSTLFQRGSASIPAHPTVEDECLPASSQRGCISTPTHSVVNDVSHIAASPRDCSAASPPVGLRSMTASSDAFGTPDDIVADREAVDAEGMNQMLDAICSDFDSAEMNRMLDASIETMIDVVCCSICSLRTYNKTFTLSLYKAF
jgi:hypothetical protein